MIIYLAKPLKNFW